MAAVRCGAARRDVVRWPRRKPTSLLLSGEGGTKGPTTREVSTADSSRASAQCVARRTDAANLSVLTRARSRRSRLPVASVLRPSGSPQDTPLIGAIWSCTGCPSEPSFTYWLRFDQSEIVSSAKEKIEITFKLHPRSAKVYFLSRRHFSIFIILLLHRLKRDS